MIIFLCFADWEDIVLPLCWIKKFAECECLFSLLIRKTFVFFAIFVFIQSK